MSVRIVELNKQRKLFIGILTVGLGALALDRLVLREDAGPDAAAAASPAASPAAEPGKSPRQGPSVAERLKGIDVRVRQAPEAPSNDAFHAPKGMFPKQPAPESKKPAPSENRPVYKLTSIVKTNKGVFAVVDKKTLQLGVPVKLRSGESMKLVEADDRQGKAVVEVDGERYELSIRPAGMEPKQ